MKYPVPEGRLSLENGFFHITIPKFKRPSGTEVLFEF